MMRLAFGGMACVLAFSAPASAADPVPEPDEEPDLSTLRLTAPPQIPPFDPELLERIRRALAAVDAGSAGAAKPAPTDE
ncbi:MAG: hypothetical protein AAGJ74_03450 [Pseudomonadota bacterium]